MATQQRRSTFPVLSRAINLHLKKHRVNLWYKTVLCCQATVTRIAPILTGGFSIGRDSAIGQSTVGTPGPGGGEGTGAGD
jgi:hypothetical protein